MSQSPTQVLIVDDNQEIHNDFRKILCGRRKVNSNFSTLAELFDDETASSESELSVEIDSALQGEEAIDLVRKSVEEGNRYSVAFVDVRMPPGLDGIETTQRLWEIDPEIQIVICSAYSDYSWQEIVRHLKRTERFLILKKPFESIEVQQLVSTLSLRWHERRSDPITGLTNRRAFMDYFRTQLRIAKDEQTELSCVMVDLDFFKRVNDIHGVSAGDEALACVARNLQELCRTGDHVCRYGGDEFCVLLRDANESDAAAWAERARTRLNESKIRSQKREFRVAASFGVSQMGDQQSTPEDVIELAEEAQRKAKSHGRDCVFRYSAVSPKNLRSELSKSRLLVPGDTAALMRPANVITKSATIRDAAELLLKNGITATPVVDDEGQMVGVLTESDVLRVFSDENQQSTIVDEAMRASVVGFSEDTDLQEIFDFVLRVSIPQVVIVRNGKPLGVIGRKALLRWLYDHGFEDEAATPENRRVTTPGTIPVADAVIAPSSGTVAS